MELGERKMRILKAIVDDYISSGVPVGSRTISKRWDGLLSPATIRNEMSDLEEMGFLEQPHTSAGRIPSDKAYRYYVDRMLRVPSLTRNEMDAITGYFNKRMIEIDDVILHTARVLSSMTDYVSVVLEPQMRPLKFKQIRLVPVTTGRAIAVVVTDEGLVKNIMLPVPDGISDRSIDMISDVLTDAMRGRPASELSKTLESIRESMNYHEGIFKSLLSALVSEQPTSISRKVVFDGVQNIFKYPEYADIERARNFMEALETKELLYNILSSAKDSSDMVVTIKIGSENEHEQLKNASIVTATYSIGGNSVGSFGVIGPTRMNYSRVVAIIDQISRSISDMLSGDD